ncbi:MAG: hypothetical protein JRI44_05455 [Deltaproteobacteria bacterium]|nr:hypothetical protein [Deltaproteobacteria bacterium]
MKFAKCNYYFYLFELIIFLLIFVISVQADEDINSRLKAGEIISFSENVKGTKVKRGTVIGVINTPPEIVWQIIKDNSHFKEFMPQTLESMIVSPETLKEILKKQLKKSEEIERLIRENSLKSSFYRSSKNKYTIYFYSLLDFPWPINNKWYIIKINRDETRAYAHIYRDSWDMVIGNLKTNQGFWFIEPYGEKSTKVTYQLLTDPGGSIPKFFIDMGVKVTMPNVIKAVKKRALRIYKKEMK